VNLIDHAGSDCLAWDLEGCVPAGVTEAVLHHPQQLVNPIVSLSVIVRQGTKLLQVLLHICKPALQLQAQQAHHTQQMHSSSRCGWLYEHAPLVGTSLGLVLRTSLRDE
jgi:hypothetical protein